MSSGDLKYTKSVKIKLRLKSINRQITVGEQKNYHHTKKNQFTVC